jgi:glycerol uptake facilitator-like aquaporin
MQKLVSEFTATAFLLVAVVGSGIMGETLAGGNAAIALLANSLATGGALVALIAAFGPVSGAHMNPAVTLADAWQRRLPWAIVPRYLAAQVAGACVGVLIAHAMFDHALIAPMVTHTRSEAGQWLAEFVATFGLLSVIWGCADGRPPLAPFAIAGYITGAYWFTSSTSFANPAVTIARTLTDTFAGIRPIDAPAFIAAQLAGAAAATALFRWLKR